MFGATAESGHRAGGYPFSSFGCGLNEPPRRRAPFADAGSFYAGLTASRAMLLTPHFSAAPLALSEMNS